jgi:hypothetical protein
VEPSGTNFCIYSQAIPTGNVSGWVHVFGGNSITVTPNSTGTLDPAGLNEADLLVAPAVNEAHYVVTDSATNLTSLTSGQVFCWSAFAKSNNTTNPFFQLGLGAMAYSPTPAFANFVLSGTGSVSAGNYTSASIQNYGNGWYRCSIVVSAAANATPQGGLSFIDTSTRTRFASFTGDAVKGGWVYGAQFEIGSVLTSYIPTTAAAVTRNAEVISVSGAVSGCIGQTEGTIYVDMIPPTGGTGVNAFLIGDGTSNNFVLLGRSGATLRGSIRANNSFILNDLTLSLGQTAIKAALAYKSGDYSLYANGSIVASGTTAFTFSSDIIGAGLTSNVDFAAPTITNRYNAYVLYPTRLTNSELADLTT